MEDQCMQCAHFHGTFKKRDPSCDAFPTGIPADIWPGDFDHNNPHEGDHGILFEPIIEGEE